MIYEQLFKSQGKKLAVLIDPGKMRQDKLALVVKEAQKHKVDFFLIGGSIISEKIDKTVDFVKNNSSLPVVLFPGSVYQLSDKADAILFLSLISGRNPEFLIGNHVVAAPFLKQAGVEVIPTGYVLIDGGRKTSVEYMSNTQAIPSNKPDIVTATAMAGEMLGMSLMYLEAGSGADMPVNENLIKNVKQNINIPLIVGGGMRSEKQVIKACNAGADIIVTGTAFEKAPNLIKMFAETVHAY